MIRLNELHPGNIVLAEYEGQKREGVVTELNHEDKEVCVETDVQEFWFSPEQLYPIPLSETQLLKLGFEEKHDGQPGTKYMKNSFRLQLAQPGDFSSLDIWWREDRRHLKHSLYVHELQNHYYQMTKVELNA
ncbi:MAG: hypothetical protein JNL51_03885 [Chitinophagaceae bacterium]|nr:hypothetical protein [Chitinophagaceae bacterium]